MTKRLLSCMVLAATGLAVSALPASAATTTVLSYTGAETTGTVAHDASGHGNDGTLHTIKMTGSAYSFNGTNSYISVPASSTLNPGTANYTYGVTMQLPAGYTFTHDLSLVRSGAVEVRRGPLQDGTRLQQDHRQRPAGVRAARRQRPHRLRRHRRPQPG